MNFNFEGKILEEAYNFCNKNLNTSSGYSETSKLVSESNKTAIFQNNLIIALLVSLHHKIDKLSSKETLPSSEIDKLIGDFSKLSTTFEKKTTSKIKTNFLVYKK